MKNTMKTHIITFVMLMGIAIGAQAQSRLEPISLQDLDIKKSDVWSFAGWYSEEARQQMIKLPTPMEDFPSALYVYRGKKQTKRLQVKWCVVNEYTKSNKPKLKLDSLEIKTDEETALAFSELIGHAVGTSMYNDARWGFDGTSYYFRDYSRVATIWSPDPGSNCRRLTDVLEKAMTAVRNQNREELKALLPEVKSLTTVFENLYPKDIDREWEKNDSILPPKTKL